MTKAIKTKLIKKAKKSTCTFKISAIGFSKKGNVLGITTNKFKLSKKMGGLHAEEALIKQFTSRLDKIIICRVGKTGDVLPIDPCEKCSKLAKKYNIKIISVS